MRGYTNVNDYLKEAERANVLALKTLDDSAVGDERAKAYALVARAYAEMAKAAVMRDA